MKEHTVKELYEWGEAVYIYCFQPQSTQKWEMAYKAKYVFHSHAQRTNYSFLDNC